MHYDFSAINDKEFELLSRDLLNKKYNMDLQNFKTGKDGGIDLRHSTNENPNSIVVQSKHYFKSGIKKLLNDLEKYEYPKIVNLSPDSYWITTSLELNPNNKKQIFEIFAPYINSQNHILGNEDLNKILSDYPEIEKRWHKLWLFSTTVLQRILSNALHGRSDFLEGAIKKNIQKFVINNTYNQAIEILTNFRYILISGLPGVGKTSIANFLSYTLLAEEYKVFFIEDISEAEEVFSSNSDEKQLFYFDDFLGSNYFDLVNPKTKESALITFLERIKSSNNKLLILTSRTTILNTALLRYNKLQDSNIDIAKIEIKLGKYTDYDKALILYNHLYYGELDDSYLKPIFNDRSYWRIINHKNYNPRIIDFITRAYNLKNIEPSQYLAFILDCLDNPSTVWEYSFSNQLNDEDRFLILILLSLGGEAEFKNLEIVFISCLENEMFQRHVQIGSNSFNNCIKRLMDGYIYGVKSEEKYTIKFLNPSINDFLVNYLKTSNQEKWKFMKMLMFYEQFWIVRNIFFNSSLKTIEEKDEDVFLTALYSKNNSLLSIFAARSINNDSNLQLKYLMLLCSINSRIRKKRKLNDLIFSFLEKYSSADISQKVFSDFLEILLIGYQKEIEPTDLNSAVSKLLCALSLNNELRIYHIDAVMRLYKEFSIPISEIISDSFMLGIVRDCIVRNIISNLEVQAIIQIRINESLSDLKLYLISYSENVIFKYSLGTISNEIIAEIDKVLLKMSLLPKIKKVPQDDEEEDTFMIEYNKTASNNHFIADDRKKPVVMLNTPKFFNSLSSSSTSVISAVDRLFTRK